MWYVILLTGIVAFLIYGFASRNNNAEVRLKIATFSFDIYIQPIHQSDHKQNAFNKESNSQDRQERIWSPNLWLL